MNVDSMLKWEADCGGVVVSNLVELGYAYFIYLLHI